MRRPVLQIMHVFDSDCILEWGSNAGQWGVKKVGHRKGKGSIDLYMGS